jgi:hypothetical protein
MSTTPLHIAATRPAGHLSRKSAEELFVLKHEAVRALTAAKNVVEHLDRALELKYADRAQLLRLKAGKDTGAVTFEDGTVKVTADLPKRVEWDQERLASIAQQIAKGGDDPAEFIEIAYRVSETKFNAWAESLRKAFEPARTVKTGKPSFKLVVQADELDRRAQVSA